MKRKRTLLTISIGIFLLLSSGAATVARGQDRPPGPDSKAREYRAQIEFVHNEFSFDGKVVKDAPYSADAVTDMTQTMSDGNRITRNSTAKVYRDSAGRTRREQTWNAIGGWQVSGSPSILISIADPVSGIYYNLNPNIRTAVKLGGPSMAELKRARTSGNAGARRKGGSAAVTDAASSDAEATRESLGTQIIEGVQAEGTRVTFTIPAGKIGNDLPIVTKNERWYSPELQVVILSKNSDPRLGETTYRLTNIVRQEPDSSLFKVPADYTMNELSVDAGSGSGDLLRKREAERRAASPNNN